MYPAFQTIDILFKSHFICALRLSDNRQEVYARTTTTKRGSSVFAALHRCLISPPRHIDLPVSDNAIRVSARESDSRTVDQKIRKAQQPIDLLESCWRVLNRSQGPRQEQLSGCGHRPVDVADRQSRLSKCVASAPYRKFLTTASILLSPKSLRVCRRYITCEPL